MFRVLAVVLLCGVGALAGCAAPGGHGTPAESSSSGGWALDCYGGFPDWSDPCTSRTTRHNGPSNENWLAVNPTDPLNVVVMGKDYNPAASDCVWMGVEVTKDGGRTWTESYLGGNLSQRQPTDASFGYTCNTDPMFAFDAQGTLYASFEVYSRLPNRAPPPAPQLGTNPYPGGQNTLFVAVSHDGGLTFGGFVAVWQGEGLTVLQDRTMLVANPNTGSIHFCWSQRIAVGTVGEVFVATSRDRGVSWDLPVLVSRPDDNRLDIPCALAVGSDGTLYAGWYSFSPGDGGPIGGTVGDQASHLEVAISGDDGHTFLAPKTVEPLAISFLSYAPNSKFYVATNLQMATAPNGTLYLVYTDKLDGHLDVLVTQSGDGGASFLSPTPVAGPDAGTHARFHGAVVVDTSNRVHITYFDRQYDPGDKLLDVTWATSADGTHFTHHRVTNTSFDGDISYHQSDVPFIGDYNGLAVVGGDLYASYPDTRMGRADLAVAHFNKAN